MKKRNITTMKINGDLHHILTKMKRGNESLSDVVFSLVGNRHEDVGFTDGLNSLSEGYTSPLRKGILGIPDSKEVNEVYLTVGILAVLGVLGFLTAFLFLRKK